MDSGVKSHSTSLNMANVERNKSIWTVLFSVQCIVAAASRSHTADKIHSFYDPSQSVRHIQMYMYQIALSQYYI